MGRNRVLSFMSQFSATHRESRTPTPTSSPPADAQQHPNHKPDLNGNSFHRQSPSQSQPQHQHDISPATPPSSSPVRAEHDPSSASINNSPSASPAGRQRSNSRPLSMVQTYQPHLMDVNEDTIPELQPIFTFLNSHQNKLYQEGYFLKLDDQDTRGKPNPDRTWTECFAQLVGTVLSLWDAAELDAAGEEGEVLPKFINLTDASIKMIESLPTRSNDEQPLQNILSISTAGRNRYLLHFNSHHSLIQWTAGIRLAMYEHVTLQEAYTGALIAGKGKILNNINLIMERTRFKTEEWVRVRFGAGVPWRRCWCVISPPDEKEYQKLQKEMKKRSPYDRSHPPVLKGDIRFYDTKKEAEKKKKARPIASITDAYSAYAIYPQSRALIEGSTLLKVEGSITIHSDPPSSTEGFVFIMPETHPAVSGFEMLLRFLFPTWDTFGLYGRPGRLVASVLDPRSLMFAMPKHKRYGYLEILDVTSLILTEGSQAWTERDWRKNLKELTGRRMTAMEDGTKTHSRSASRSSKRLSFGPPNTGPSRPRVNFADDTASVRSSRSMSLGQPGPRTDSVPPDHNFERAPSAMAGSVLKHARNSSDTQVGALPDLGMPPQPGRSSPPGRGPERAKAFASDLAATPERVSSEDERPVRTSPPQNIESMRRMETPEPVNAPPAFSHQAGAKPNQKPYHSPEMRRQNSRLSITTLSQLAKAGGLTPEAFSDEALSQPSGEENTGSASSVSASVSASASATASGQTDPWGQAVQPQVNANTIGMSANYNASREAITSPSNHSNLNSDSSKTSPNLPPPQVGLSQKRSKSPLAGSSTGPLPTYRHANAGPMGPPATAPPQPGTAPARGALLIDHPSGQQLPDGHGPAPTAPHGAPHSPPPGSHHGPPNGPPPTVSLRGPPPPAHGSYPPRDPRMGPPGPPGPSAPYHYQNYRGPPPGPRHTPPPNSATRGPPSYHVQASPPPSRKPLPQRTTSLQRRDDSLPSTPSSSAGSFTNRMLDEAALSQIRPPLSSRPGGPAPTLGIMRHDSDRSGGTSHYEDGSSTASPDYASTRQSSETQDSVERPRAGVLRTVGETAAQPPPASKVDSSDYAIPEINFGPSILSSASTAPRSKTPTPLSTLGGTSPGSGSVSGHVTAQPGPPSFSPAPGRKSPGPAAGYTHFRQESDDTIRRNVAWQPGVATVGSTFGGERALSPEQFVQQRAVTSTTPLYAHGHQRQQSGNALPALRTGTPTPPLKRTGSQELLGSLGGIASVSHSRNNSADLLQRPSSQGTAAVLSGGEISSHLSAREQEHVARVTGSRLINVAGNRNIPQPQGGLVGAIEAREREKAQIKHGLSGQAVAQAIDQRQREQQIQAQRVAQSIYAQQQAQMAAQQQQNIGMAVPMGQGPAAPSMYSVNNMGPMGMGMGPGPVMSPPRKSSFGPGIGPGTPQQRVPPNFISPPPQAYAQGGGWSKPNMQQRAPPQQGQPQGAQGAAVAMRGGQPQGPGFSAPPQGQYSPPGGPGVPRPGTPGRMQFQGQAF